MLTSGVAVTLPCYIQLKYVMLLNTCKVCMTLVMCGNQTDASCTLIDAYSALAGNVQRGLAVDGEINTF